MPHERLIAIVQLLEGDTSEVGSRHALKRTLDDVWRSVEQVETVGDFTWSCVSLPRLLQKIAAECTDFQTILRDLFVSKPCTSATPYNLVVYTDEVLGNAVRTVYIIVHPVIAH